jgi:hypothetical protein
MKPCILFRGSLAEEGELEVAKKYFDVYENRCAIPPGSKVIGRYSVLPYYQELEKDLAINGSKLINSYSQYNYIADMQNWYQDLDIVTPKTWFRPEDIPMDEPGAFVLKGATNSRKQLWKTHMFAVSREHVMDVYGKLLDDSLPQHQGIYVRQYVELMNYGHDCVTGMPISKEFRCFFYRSTLLCKEFYWSQHVADIDPKPDVNEIPEEFLRSVSKIVCPNTNFWVVDVAQTKTGRWIVIELNDGQMAGLSCNSPDILYRNLSVAYNRYAILR